MVVVVVVRGVMAPRSLLPVNVSVTFETGPGVGLEQLETVPDMLVGTGVGDTGVGVGEGVNDGESVGDGEGVGVCGVQLP